jgi:hypothetical protein
MMINLKSINCPFCKSGEKLQELKKMRMDQNQNSCSEIRKDIQKEINDLIDEVMKNGK